MASKSSGLQEFSGIKYKLESSENCNAIMKAIGVSAMKMKFGNVCSSEETVELDQDEEGQVIITTTIKSKKHVMKFKLGEEFDEKTVDGRSAKSIITQQGNKLVQLQKGKKKTCEIVREFAKDKLVITITADDIKGIKTFSVVPQ